MGVHVCIGGLACTHVGGYTWRPSVVHPELSASFMEIGSLTGTWTHWLSQAG